jgi:hypothetical protein
MNDEKRYDLTSVLPGTGDIGGVTEREVRLLEALLDALKDGFERTGDLHMWDARCVVWNLSCRLRGALEEALEDEAALQEEEARAEEDARISMAVANLSEGER